LKPHAVLRALLARRGSRVHEVQVADHHADPLESEGVKHRVLPRIVGQTYSSRSPPGAFKAPPSLVANPPPQSTAAPHPPARSRALAFGSIAQVFKPYPAEMAPS